MGDVNNHAHSIHLPNELPAVLAYATPLRFRLAEGIFQEGGIGELVVTVVRKGGIAYAKGVVQPKIADKIPNLVKTLDPEW